MNCEYPSGDVCVNERVTSSPKRCTTRGFRHSPPWGQTSDKQLANTLMMSRKRSRKSSRHPFLSKNRQLILLQLLSHWGAPASPPATNAFQNPRLKEQTARPKRAHALLAISQSKRLRNRGFSSLT